MKCFRMLLSLILCIFAPSWFSHASAVETPPDDDAAIRALVSDWYEEHRAAEAGHVYRLLAPGAIDASPGHVYADDKSAKLGPPVYTSLAATALQFDHEITRLKLSGSMARVDVWERGYYYAWSAEQTYERARSTTFILEKQDDGRWLVLAHKADSVGIPPNRITNPMPDLRDLYYATEGKDRDPRTDAGAAPAPAY